MKKIKIRRFMSFKLMLALILSILSFSSTTAHAVVVTAPLENFELASSYANIWSIMDKGGTGTLTRTTTIKHSGSYSMKFDYNFSGVSDPEGDEFVRARAWDLECPGTTSNFSAWIYGDGSSHQLKFKFQNPDNGTQYSFSTYVSWTGWQQVTNTFSPAVAAPLDFVGIDVMMGSGLSSTGTIYVDDLTTTADITTALVKITPTFSWLRGIGAGTNPGLVVRVYNLAANSKTYELNATAVNVDGDTEAAVSNTSFTVAAGTSADCSLSLTLPHRGFFTVTIKIRIPSDSSTWLKTRIMNIGSVASVSTALQPNSPIGINAAVPSLTSMKIAKQLGINWVRAAMTWETIQPTSSAVYKFGTWDDAVRDTKAAGVHILGILSDGNPSWVTESPTDDQAFYNFANQMARRYGTNQVSSDLNFVHYWETWNEPNNDDYFNGTAQAFGSIAYYARQTIRGIDSTAKVAHPGSDKWDFRDDLSYTKDTVSQFGGNFPFDLLTVHPYSENTEAPEQEYIYDRLTYDRSYMAACGSGNPVWADEFGWPTSTSISYATQAAYMARAYVECLSGGAQKIFGYQLYSGYDTSDAQNRYGILKVDLTPNPAAIYIAQLSYKLNTAAYNTRNFFGATGQDQAHFFRTSTEAIAVLWSLDGQNTVNGSWPTGTYVQDADGATMGTANIRVGGRPVYISAPIAQESALLTAVRNATWN